LKHSSPKRPAQIAQIDVDLLSGALFSRPLAVRLAVEVEEGQELP
jgi:hypothetical protein